MAKVFVSPGVYSNEIDESFVPAGAGVIGAALIGLTQRGPAFLPTAVENFGDFRDSFGGLSTKMYAPYAAKSYLRHGSPLNMVRVLGRDTTDTGGCVLLAFPFIDIASAALSASNVVLGTLKFRGSTEQVYLSGSPTNFAIAIPGKGVTATNLSLNRDSNNYVKKAVGMDPTTTYSGESLTALFVDAVFDYYQGSVTGTVSGATADATFAAATGTEAFNNVTGGFAPAETPMITSQNFGGTVYNLFKIYSLGDGTYENNRMKVSFTQVDTATTGFPTFSVVVRDAGDTDNNPIILESFLNVNLDKSSKNYIGRVIGDRRVTYSLSNEPPEILFDGQFDNRSKFVRVTVEDGFPQQARPSGFAGVAKFAESSVSGIPDLPTKLNHLNARSAVDANVFLGIDFTREGISDRLKKTVTSPSGAATADYGMLFFSVTGDYSGSAAINGYTLVDIVGSNSANFSATNKLRFSVPMSEGWDGFDPRSDLLVDINDGTLSADFNIAIKTLANPDEIDFNLLAIPGAHSSGTGQVPDRAIEMVNDRADAFYILDIADGTTTGAGLSLTIAAAQSESDKYDTNYAATYFPWLRINDVDNDELIWVPPSVEVMGVYAFNDRIAQPWWAPAGFNRGGIENATEARRRLTQQQRDDLYERRVNPIATFSGQGLVVWGQKTLQKKQSSLDRVNVRRMLLEVRKTIAGFSRIFVFDPNNVSSRQRLLSRINSYLSQVRDANGLVEFRAVLDETTTTPDLIDRNTMKGKIFLRPTSAAEVIIFDYNLSNLGLAISE